MPEIGERRVRTATFVVAASNSMVQDKAMADYVCDGVNDHVEIQAALDALPASGGEVKLLDGTYNIEVALVLDSYQTLQGQGRSTILTTTTIDLDIITATGGAGTEKVGIVITDLCIDGNAGGVANDDGILWTYVDNSKVLHCWILDNGEHGINLINCDNNIIIDNDLEGSANGVLSTTSTRNLIAINYIKNHGVGISLASTSDSNDIIGNVIIATTVSAIKLNSCDSNTISANTVVSNTGKGIYLTLGSLANTIVGNNCFGNTGIAIQVEDSSNDNTITGNSCVNSSLDGIFVTGSLRNTINGNTVKGNGYGIEVTSSADYTSVTGNICANNTNIGLSLSDVDHCTVSGNTFIGNEQSGIYIYGDQNTIVGNTCEENLHHGIECYGAKHSTIVGNTCVANSQELTNTYDDINLESSDYNNIQGNVCRAGGLANKPRYGISVAGATCDKNKIAGNDLYDDGFLTATFNDAGTLTEVEDNNRGIKINQIKMFRYMKNTSGVQRVAGDVVSLKAVAAGNEVTAPAAVGERQVYGMVAETINDTAWGLIQVKGKTTALKGTNVGGGDIAIGDNLITENGVRARKAAAATDPIFARALEALAAADGVIDAYIVSPWD
jgi:parallel beta-helix repeat protein